VPKLPKPTRHTVKPRRNKRNKARRENRARGMDVERPEVYSIAPNGLVARRTVLRRDGTKHTTQVSLPRAVKHRGDSVAAERFDSVLLRQKGKPRRPRGKGRQIRIADLFSSCGLMSLGAVEACRAIGKQGRVAVAMDVNDEALAVLSANFPEARIRTELAENALNGMPGYAPTAQERRFLKKVGRIDLLVGGPPCQGNSDLNNHTRRDDPKNSLYDRMARFAELTRPRHIIIENVAAVQHDEGAVVDRTIAWLDELGYKVDQGLVEIDSLGGAQKRRRHVVVASLHRRPRLQQILEKYARRPRTVGWAISDLRKCDGGNVMRRAGKLSKRNQERVAYLFRYRQYDLPDSRRPDCHRLKTHSYKSSYGRMHWDRPSQTITSGFTSMGQGRFVHPLERRTLTPQEAARIQSIPDYFKFDMTESRTGLAEMIGNAVPPKLTYVLALELLR
jgi:DNA (cytosine-5)-methyltransferase 1